MRYSLVVQWLGLRTTTAMAAQVQSPIWELRSQKLLGAAKKQTEAHIMHCGHNFYGLRCNSKTSRNFFFLLQIPQIEDSFLSQMLATSVTSFLSLLSQELSPFHLKEICYSLFIYLFIYFWHIIIASITPLGVCSHYSVK